jgi:hypothetical protein
VRCDSCGDALALQCAVPHVQCSTCLLYL